jgi:primosomal replication protein N
MLIGVSAGILGYFFVYNKPHTDFEKKAPDFTLSAEELYNQFLSDRNAAEIQYNGKVVQIEGVLAQVESNDSLAVIVFVFNQGIFGDEGIRCTLLPGFIADAATLSPGNTLTVKGFLSGYNETDVIMEHCSIIKP